MYVMVTVVPTCYMKKWCQGDSNGRNLLIFAPAQKFTVPMASQILSRVLKKISLRIYLCLTHQSSNLFKPGILLLLFVSNGTYYCSSLIEPVFWAREVGTRQTVDKYHRSQCPDIIFLPAPSLLFIFHSKTLRYLLIFQTKHQTYK